LLVRQVLMAHKNKFFNNQTGQSTIEFIFSFSFAVFVLVYTVKVALNYTTGYLVHYATFMAARTYLVFDDVSGSDTTAMGRAKQVFDGTSINLFNKNIAEGDLNFTNFNTPAKYPHAGAYFDWKTSFSVGGLFGGGQTLELRSEAFLGREPDRVACGLRLCEVASDGGGNCGGRAFTLGDNGC
jgi:hypothetical protein